MIRSGLIWRMAAGNLRKQWKQTLLTVFAGAIGAMLIAISAVNYESVQSSGKAWIETHLGPINWKLSPEKSESGGFTAAEIATLLERTENDGYTLLPYVKTEAAVIAADAEAGAGAALKNILFIGFPMEEAVSFDPVGNALWREELADDELIINRETANLLDVQTGDVLAVAVQNGEQLFRIRAVTEQRGLTGYLETGTFSDTIIGSESAVRKLSGRMAGSYDAVLLGHTNPAIDLQGMFLIQDLPFRVDYLKLNAQQKFEKMNFTLIIGMISAVAIASSMLFMRQVLTMIGESRQEMYGILRAIGFSKPNISAMFTAEALLLSFFSALLGTIAGMLGGYQLIRLFYGSYAAELSRMAGSNITVQPYISLSTTVIVFAVILLFLAMISLLAARRVSQFGIVEALRGPSQMKQAGRGKGRVRGKKGVAALALGIIGISGTAVHFVFAFVQPPELKGENILLIAATWLIACCYVLSIFLTLMDKMDVPLHRILRIVGIPRLSVMLALKYPRWHKGRSYTTALLFSLVMMTITFVVCILQLILANGDVDRTNQSVFGFGGYASYRTTEEQQKIVEAAAKDPFIHGQMKGTVTIEPFMLSMVENGIAQAVVPVTEELVGNHPKALLARAPNFSDDAAAWEAVRNNPEYIILPHFFSMKDPLYSDDITLVKAGDSIRLPVYESKLRSGTEAWEPLTERTFIVAGFVPNDASNLLMDFYGATFMNEKVVDELRPFGHKWMNQNDLGFVLFQFDYKDIKTAQALEERFAVQGVLTFNVPYLKNSAEQLLNKQLGIGFIGFTVISAFIGLMGLAIIQFRSVRERSKQVGMMRCIGVPSKQIYGMFFIEGFVISVVGLLAGWAIGSSGVRIFSENLKHDIRVYEEPAIFHYPFGILLPIIGSLVIASFFINLLPARAALRLKAVDALRVGNE
jgi:putative ABC transport system permease protein